jgi:hypothetical protein
MSAGGPGAAPLVLYTAGATIRKYHGFRILSRKIFRNVLPSLSALSHSIQYIRYNSTLCQYSVQYNVLYSIQRMRV